MPWLRHRLRAVNASATDLARHLERPPARVYEMIKGQRQFQPHEIAKAAFFLKIGEAQLLELIEGRVDAKDVAINSVNALPWANVSETSVPLLRTTLAPHGRWLLHVTNEEGDVIRPDFTRFSVTAFAIVVQDERNSPVYHARDRILIDPESSVSPGDDVVLSSVADLDTREEVHVIPGQLKKMSEASWSLKQYANADERSFSKRQFPSAWKIVSRFMPD
jgi:SOS-response transcriptional repressor LexA